MSSIHISRTKPGQLQKLTDCVTQTKVGCFNWSCNRARFVGQQELLEGRPFKTDLDAATAREFIEALEAGQTQEIEPRLRRAAMRRVS